VNNIPNPYIGPRPYERRDREHFYGRKRESRDLLSLILSERAVLFYAQSGAGKTSLLNAQIIPALEDEGFRIFPVARVGSGLPLGIDPTSVSNVFVFSALLGLAGDRFAPETLLAHSLSSFLSAQCEGDERLPLVIFDQFEELFTTHREYWCQAREVFLQVAAAMAAIPQLGVVFAMREDYVAEIDPYITLIPNGLRTRFRMERLGWEGAIEAVARPASCAGVPFGPGVAERLVENLQRIKVQRTVMGVDGPMAEEMESLGPYVEPVHLQVVCSRLWDSLPEQDDFQIQWSEVEQYGNLDKSLADFYQEGLRAAQKESGVGERELRRWFADQLITPMQTRGLVMRGKEHTAGLPNAAVEVLERRYLIRADLRGGVRWYELVHDRLIDPIRKSNEAWELARETPLRAAAREWKQSGNEELYYRGPVLQAGLKWAADHPEDVEPYELEFLEASRQVEKLRVRALIFQWGAVAVGVVALILVTWFAWGTARSNLETYSARMSAMAISRAESDQAGSVMLAREAVLMNHVSPLLQFLRPGLEPIDKGDAEVALRKVLLNFYPSQSLTDLESDVQSVLYTPDGQSLYLGLKDGRVLLWDLKSSLGTPPRLLREKGDSIASLALSADEKTLLAAVSFEEPAVGSWLELWTIGSTEWRKVMLPEGRTTGPERILTAAFSPSGQWLATGGYWGSSLVVSDGRNRGVVRMWSLSYSPDGEMLATPALIFTQPEMAVPSVAFSPDGYYLAGGSFDRHVYLWVRGDDVDGLPSGILTATLSGHTGPVRAVAFDRFGRYIASGSDDKTIRIYRVESWEPVDTLIGHKGGVMSLAFDAQDDYLLSGSWDMTARLWNINESRSSVAAIFSGPRSYVGSVAFSPDGTKAAIGAQDYTAWWWDLSAPRREGYSTLSGHKSRVYGMAFGNQIPLLASGDANGELRIWSLKSGETMQSKQSDGGRIWNLVYSPPDDRYLVTCSQDGMVRVWDTDELSLTTVLSGHSASVNAAAFSPDGRWLVTVSDDGFGRLWNTRDWTEAAVMAPLTMSDTNIYAVAYSPDGQWIAMGYADDAVRLWQVSAEGQEVRATLVYTLTGHTDDVQALAFSPDGKLLVSGSADKSVRLWSMETFGPATSEPLTQTSYVYSLAFGRESRPLILVVGTYDGSLWFWDLTKGQAPEQVGMLSSHMDVIWQLAISPDGKTLASASWDGSIRRYPFRYSDVVDYSWVLIPNQGDVSGMGILP